jgi:SAM-dependent methyltransferase
MPSIRSVIPRIRAIFSPPLNYVNYNDYNARDAADRVQISRSKVLVVGANTGEDCKRFIYLGAPEVHGLDVITNVGADFTHDRVTYHAQSIEKCDLPSNSFDLVYSFATMEHVPDIAAGYSEMARVVKPGGLIFSMASPLWNSPYGHHMGCFQGHPWIHLAFDTPGIIAYCQAQGITGERGRSVPTLLSYIMNRANFNMRSASEYEAAMLPLTSLDYIENELLKEDASLLEHPLGQKVLAKGFSAAELLSQTHRVIATKR